MKVLVTGGAGFIGSHLCEQLLANNCEVAIIDDLNDFYSPADKEKNLQGLRQRGNVYFRKCDIRDQDGVYKVFEEVRPDAIVHLAARAGVRPSLEQPFLYEQVNVYGTLVMLEAARRFGVNRFVFASSSSIYGIGNKVPFREDDSESRPVSPYAATKIAGEKLCFTYSHLYGLKIVCLRFFTVYGPRQRPDLAIRKFIERIDQGRTIPVFGDGSSGRDYTFVGDTVSGILGALRYDTPFDVFNLGNSSPITLTELIRAIERALGKQAHIERLPDQPGDVPITYADITKAQRLLGYSPSTSLEKGLERFIDWYRATSTDVNLQV